jgi:hypothetical protein
MICARDIPVSGVAVVVRELEVTDDRAVAVLALGLPQVHASVHVRQQRLRYV